MSDMDNKEPLWQNIKNFSNTKVKLGVGLIILGSLGLVLPVIPGILLLAVGLFLLKPEWYEKFRERFSSGREE